MPGTLFVVGTPIGNLEDLTFRALRTLKEVDLIAAEDTRRTSKLLAHYDVRKPLLSVREHNEVREIPRILERLRRGQSIALVTDAGTPGIADPGPHLVRAVRDAGYSVVPIPGPSAVATALSVSGLSGSEFVFLGFPPRSGTARADWLARAADDPRILILFEAPHRVQRTLGDLAIKLAKRQIIVFRELTKFHEQYGEWPNSPAESGVATIGELTIVVGPDLSETTDQTSAERVAAMFGQMIDMMGLDEESAVRAVASVLQTGPQKIRKALKQHKISVNQLRNAEP